jgi:alpha-tubulin suppressor-like RCC1 family protein
MYCPNLEPTEDCPGPPATVEGLLEPVVDAAGSSVSTCGLLETGRIMCWGNNQFGYLGDGTIKDREQPTSVIGLDDVVIVKVSMNSRPTCALSEDGRVFCWGDNRTGAIGNGTLSQREPTPSEVVDLPESITAISAGGEHVCAVGESGAIYCWGRNYYGQLGDGRGLEDCPEFDSCDTPFPVRVVGFGPEPAGGWPEPPEEQ